MIKQMKGPIINKYLSLDDRYVLFNPFMLSFIANCQHKDKSWQFHQFCDDMDDFI